MDIFRLFENLVADEDTVESFKDVEVKKLCASSSNKNEAIIHTESSRILSNKEIKKLENTLNSQKGKYAGNSYKIKTKYKLSSQYDPKNLWDVIKSDTEEEIRNENRIASMLLCQSELEFSSSENGTNDILTITADNNFIFVNESEYLKNKLTNIFNDRYGFNITILYNFVDMQKKEEEEKPEVFKYPVRHTETGANTEQKAPAAENKNTSKKENEKDGKVTVSVTNTGASQVKASSDPSNDSNKNDYKKTGNKKSFDSKFMKKRLFEDPDIFYGRPFEDPANPLDCIKISDIEDEIGEVVVQGKITFLDEKDTKKGDRKIVIVDITDFTDSITFKIFPEIEEYAAYKDKLKEGNFVKLKGQALFDNYKREIGLVNIVGIKQIKSFVKKRMDNYEGEKRVELHAHTIFSEMDAVIDPKVLVETAFDWGMPGVAITDHGVVQAFPVANHALDPKKFKDDPEKMERYQNFKIIYGVECYLVDDDNKIVENDKGQTLDATAVVYDIETTGFDKENDKIIEIGAVKVQNGEIIDRFSTFIDPKIPIPARIEKLTGISDDMVIGAETIDQVLPKFLDFCKDCVLVAHNAGFDTGFTRIKAAKLGLPFDYTIVDTVGLARVLLPDIKNTKLDTVAEAVNVVLKDHHRAVNDAEATAGIYLKFLQKLKEKGINDLAHIEDIAVIPPEQIKKMHLYHCILLIKNDIGRINLYKMISMSHIKYFSRFPRIPKSLLTENREGIIVGSACEAGELFQALIRNESPDEIDRLCEFYDYYEIQPLGNNIFMIDSDKVPQVTSVDDLIEYNKKIISLGEKYNKPVVATTDCHFLNPEDESYRRMMLYAKWEDDEPQAPLYFRTTQEMLDEFSYLPKEKAEEIVITNTHKIYDMCEKISPVRPDKCPPVIENSDEDLRKICYNKAHSMYGENLPEPVAERLEHELKSIISNGYSVMYIIAQKLVWKSNEDGYLVGSRGSVGSSFVATMSGITEVNPLRPHYYCPNCFYSDFDSETVIEAQRNGICGFDLPDKICPNCGKKLIKDGHDIPFETFLGFYGDKEPDIDLNFSDEYQSKAHEYTEVIFGKGQTFKAGTVGTLADKTAYGYVLKYDECHGMKHRDAEVKRLSSGMIGVRRTTGQHPGGIVVLPFGENIYSFTPIQRPANDMTSNIVTTHFEYHSIDHNLLKLDILGHQDPTMIRRLSDLTGVDALNLPMDDPKIVSLFHSTEALGIKPEDISGNDLGSLGLPELGTNFVMQMLRETKPKNFSDMVRISGLSHGTNVWTNNAQELINNGTCTLDKCICTRDDIMRYLITMGVEKGLAFKIMESVRKGRGLTPEMEASMKEKNVPDWYIWSCKRIQYMFPKAHATAYMMMAFRVAYFKIYHPLAYYAAYFGIRANSFDYEKMCFGIDVLRKNMKEIQKKIESNEASDKEKDTLENMKLVEEMYARGLEFMPIDLFKAKAHAFQIIDGKLMPSFDSIEGLGEKAADLIVEAVKAGPFVSRDDFKTRTKATQTVVDKMAEFGILGSIPKSDQFSIMDLFG
ncbi:MAG: PolC-type DNA polymerase III [Lachnospiraceae bacterium]|nr:PolC-type DNA polymerase III [Lachnospiraceae bacterium]